MMKIDIVEKVHYIFVKLIFQEKAKMSVDTYNDMKLLYQMSKDI